MKIIAASFYPIYSAAYCAGVSVSVYAASVYTDYRTYHLIEPPGFRPIR